MSRRVYFATVAMTMTCTCFAAQPDQPLPDSRVTPGATLAVTTSDICVVGYTKKVRNVPAGVKRQVYQEYGAVNRPGAYEVDHLIPLELGGSNSIKNLWPESYTLEWSARIKDELENRLHLLACDGTVGLGEAQGDIATDWIAAYKKYFRTDSPLSPAQARRVGRKRHRNAREY